ncbi:hypothetical protein K438DRAFT_1681424 [Mycena galopus ATCC 62051]|nr:hypothetical protein K438DRAFT_1681424 [Mycena galopus ATCC 62051]
MDVEGDPCSLRNHFSSSRLPTPGQIKEVLEHLRSNSVPSDASGLRSTIAASLPDVAHYDTEIGRLQQIMDRLVAERDALLQYNKKCSSVFAPVRRLPPEILAKIFSLCSSTPILYSDGTQSIQYDVPDPVRQPHLERLLRVCVVWYNTVVTTPSLWANIEVDLEGPNTSGEERFIHLSRSLDRSAHCPLTLHVSACSERPGLELLGRCAARWRTAALYLTGVATPSLSHAKGHFSRLEYLGLGGEDAKGLDLFETAPILRRVILSQVDGPLPKLPWRQLRHITFHVSQLSDMDEDIIAGRLAILPHCSDQCEFNMDDLQLSQWNASTSTLVRVQSNIPVLRLTVFDEDEGHSRLALGTILGALTLPCLQELHLCSSRPNEHPLLWPRDHFQAFASRSCLLKTLTKLFLYDVVITEEELVECLSEMPALLELFIQDVGGSTSYESRILITDSLLERLVRRPDTSCLAPSMNHFSFGTLSSFDDGALIKFVESRSSLGALNVAPFTIQAFDLAVGGVGGGPAFGVTAVARMVALEKQGLLRWSRHDRESLGDRSPDVHLF